MVTLANIDCRYNIEYVHIYSGKDIRHIIIYTVYSIQYTVHLKLSLVQIASDIWSPWEGYKTVIGVTMQYVFSILRYL